MKYPLSFLHQAERGNKNRFLLREAGKPPLPIFSYQVPLHRKYGNLKFDEQANDDMGNDASRLEESPQASQPAFCIMNTSVEKTEELLPKAL